MVIFLIALLCVSVAGLVSLIAIKRWEMRSGKLVMGTLRPKAGAVLGEGLHFVEQGLPHAARRMLRRAYIVAWVLFHRAVAWAVLHVERVLERTLHTLRHHTNEERVEGDVSPFLREVAEHKKQLQERSGEKRSAIYEE